MVDNLLRLFERDLNKLREEIIAYPDEGQLWIIADGITNCAGNLAIHLAGNLRHFVGAELGGTGYIRDRHAEFHDRDIPRDEILDRIDQALTDVTTTLKQIDQAALSAVYPLDVFGFQMTTGYFLIHLQGHLNYHLGQINYHRRLLTN